MPLDRNAELEDLDRDARRNRQAAAVASQSTPAQTASAGQLGRLHPSLSAGVVRALSAVGVSPTADWILDLAREEAIAGSERGFMALMQVVDARVARERRRQMAEVGARYEAGEIDVQQMLDEGARIGSATNYGRLGDAAGVGDEARILDRAGRAQAWGDRVRVNNADVDDGGGLIDGAYGVLKGAVRNVTGVLDVPYQMTQQTFRATLDAYREDGLLGAVSQNTVMNPLGFNPVGLALDATGVVDGYGAADQARQRLADTAQTNLGAGLMTGFDTGDGFFVGGAQEQLRRSAERNYAPKIDGRVATIGRWTAERVFTPDTRPYDLLSGLVDATVAVAGPGEIAIDEAFKVLSAGRRLQTIAGAAPRVDDGARAALSQVRAEVGALRTHRAVVDPTRVRAFLDSNAGASLVSRIAQAEDAFDLYQMFGRRIDGDLIAQLRNAPDEGVVRAVLNRHLGADLAKPGRFTGARLSASMTLQTMAPTVGRLAARVPTGIVDLEDSAEAARQMENLVRNVRGSGEDVRYWVNRMLGEGMPRSDEYLARITAEQANLRTMADELETRLINAATEEEAAELSARLREVQRMIDNPGVVTNRIDRNQIITEFMAEVGGRMAGRVGEDVVRRWAADWEESRAYWVKLIGDGEGAVVNMNPWISGTVIVPKAADDFAAEGTLFHGSSRRLEQVDSYGSRASANLYGPGFYTTDDPSVALGYTNKGARRSGAEPTIHAVDWTGDAPPRLIDVAAPMPQDLRNAVSGWLDEARAAATRGDLFWYLDPEDVVSRILPILDDAASTYDDLWETVKTLMDDVAAGADNAPRSLIDEFVYSLHERLHDVYDGIAHAGGARTGGKPHNVSILFDTDQGTRNIRLRPLEGTKEVPRAAVTAPGAPTPHLIAEHVGRYAPVGDVRVLRREFSRPLFRYLSGAEVTGTTAARTAKRAARAPITVPTTLLLHLQDKVWKPLRLIRLAWPLRVLTEEQVRIAAAGYDGLFNHPFRYIASVLADDGYLANKLQNRDVARALDAGDAEAAQQLEEAFGIAASHSDQFRQAMFSSSASLGFDRDLRRVRNQGYRSYPKNDPEYALGWQDEVARLAASPEVQAYLKAIDDGGGFDGFVDALIAMPDYRRSLQRAHPDADLMSPEGIRSWAQTVVDRVRQVTMDDPELLEALRTRRLRGEFLWREGSAELNPRATEQFRAKVDEVGELRPGQVVGPNRQYVQDNRGKWNRAVDLMMAGLMTHPANTLSRSPLFLQAYTESLIRHARALDPADAELLIEDVVRLGARKSDVRQIRYLASQTTPHMLPIADLEDLAKAEALEVVKKTLFDVSERGQFFDVFRVVFPFGEAWKEVVTRWAGLVAQNPNVVRRAEQVIEGARDPEVAETLGLPAPDGQGFFYSNSFGDEVFTYPFSAGINEALAGVPIPLTGRVQGLSMMTEVLPGVGPAMQLPAAVLFEDLLGDNPRWDWARELVSPFGSAKGPDGVWTLEDGVAEFIPPWMQRLMSAGQLSEDPRMVEAYADAVDYATNYLASTGQYAIYGPDARDETARLIDDARDAATKLLVVRSMGTFIGPVAPSSEPYVANESGGMTLARVLGQAFYDMQAEDYDSATQRFIERYGEFAFLGTVGQTRSVALGGALPPYKEAEAWLAEHQGVDRDFTNVFGFFAPQTGTFDPALLERSVRNGDRVRNTPEQRVALAQHQLGSMMYWSARDQLPDELSQEQRVWLFEYEQQLQQEFPGFNNLEANGINPRVPRDQVIRELELAVGDDRFADNDVAQATAAYLEARQQAFDQAVALGLSPNGELPPFSRATRAEPLRAWLFDYGSTLAREVPGFDRVFQQVFMAELPMSEGES